MKRRFLIPIACALTFHAVLLFGFKGEPDISEMKLDVETVVYLKPLPDAFYEPPADETDELSSDAEARKGEPDQYRPQGADLPQKPRPKDFIVHTVDTPPMQPIKVSKIPAGIIGLPEGVEDGTRIIGGVYERSHLDNSPRVLVQAPPLYPSEAKMRGFEGNVVVAFTVGETGRVIALYVVRSSAPIFDHAALSAVKKWRFEPGRRNGRAVRFKMMVPIQFSLEE